MVTQEFKPEIVDEATSEAPSIDVSSTEAVPALVEISPLNDEQQEHVLLSVQELQHDLASERTESANSGHSTTDNCELLKLMPQARSDIQTEVHNPEPLSAPVQVPHSNAIDGIAPLIGLLLWMEKGRRQGDDDKRIDIERPSGE